MSKSNRFSPKYANELFTCCKTTVVNIPPHGLPLNQLHSRLAAPLKPFTNGFVYENSYADMLIYWVALFFLNLRGLEGDNEALMDAFHIRVCRDT